MTLFLRPVFRFSKTGQLASNGGRSFSPLYSVNAKNTPARSEVTARVGFRFFPSARFHRTPRSEVFATRREHAHDTLKQIFASDANAFSATRNLVVSCQWLVIGCSQNEPAVLFVAITDLKSTGRGGDREKKRSIAHGRRRFFRSGNLLFDGFGEPRRREPRLADWGPIGRLLGILENGGFSGIPRNG